MNPFDFIFGFIYWTVYVFIALFFIIVFLKFGYDVTGSVWDSLFYNGIVYAFIGSVIYRAWRHDQRKKIQ
jgi:hypothetical protein